MTVAIEHRPGSPPSVARYRRKLLVARVTVGAALSVGCSGQPADQQDSLTDDPAHWDALRDERIAAQGGYLLCEVDSLPTDVEFVRYRDRDEWAEVHAQCLRDQGFHVEVTRRRAVRVPRRHTQTLPGGGRSRDRATSVAGDLHHDPVRGRLMAPVQLRSTRPGRGASPPARDVPMLPPTEVLHDR